MTFKRYPCGTYPPPPKTHNLDVFFESIICLMKTSENQKQSKGGRRVQKLQGVVNLVLSEELEEICDVFPN